MHCLLLISFVVHFFPYTGVSFFNLLLLRMFHICLSSCAVLLYLFLIMIYQFKLLIIYLHTFYINLIWYFV